MTKEELLKVRYKVICPYPEMERHNVEVGDIITEGEVTMTARKQDGTAAFTFDWETFPNIFRKLEWWQERKFTELPQYIKWTSPGSDMISFFKVDNWYTNPNTSQVAGVVVESGRIFINDCVPATEEEFNSQKQ